MSIFNKASPVPMRLNCDANYDLKLAPLSLIYQLCTQFDMYIDGIGKIPFVRKGGGSNIEYFRWHSNWDIIEEGEINLELQSNQLIKAEYSPTFMDIPLDVYSGIYLWPFKFSPLVEEKLLDICVVAREESRLRLNQELENNEMALITPNLKRSVEFNAQKSKARFSATWGEKVNIILNAYNTGVSRNPRPFIYKVEAAIMFGDILLGGFTPYYQNDIDVLLEILIQGYQETEAVNRKVESLKRELKNQPVAQTPVGAIDTTYFKVWRL